MPFNKKIGSAKDGAADYLAGDLAELDYVPVLKNESSTDTRDINRSNVEGRRVEQIHRHFECVY